MRIANLVVDTEVLLAPMAAVTDLPFRTICEEHGVGLTITEFLSARALCEGAKKTTQKLTASLDGRQFGVQIFGRELDALAQAALLARDIGASLVDKMCIRDSGSSLSKMSPTSCADSPMCSSSRATRL